MANQDASTESTSSAATIVPSSSSSSSSAAAAAVAAAVSTDDVDCGNAFKKFKVECENMSAEDDHMQKQTEINKLIKESSVHTAGSKVSPPPPCRLNNGNKKNCDHASLLRHRNKLTFKKKLNRLLSTRNQNSTVCSRKHREQQQNNKSKQPQLKMPILVRIELTDTAKSGNSNDDESVKLNAASDEPLCDDNFQIEGEYAVLDGNGRGDGGATVIFNDYVLIPSQTNYKYLIYTVFESIKLSDKSAYLPLDGYLQIANWSPISLNSISKIVQCRPPSRSPLESPTLIVDDTMQRHEATANGDACDANENQIESNLVELKKNRIASAQYGETKQVNSTTTKSSSCVVANIAETIGESEQMATASATHADLAVDDELASLSSGDENDTTKQVITVYDMLSQVIGFACLSIRVVTK